MRVARTEVIMDVKYLVLCLVCGRCLPVLICKIGLHIIRTL